MPPASIPRSGSFRSDRRDLQPEWMDQPELDGAEHRRALAGLGRLNRLSRTTATLWKEIAPLLKSDPERTWTLLDVACGGGDLAVGLAQRAHRSGLKLRISGCDISPTAVQRAERLAHDAGVEADFMQHDIFAGVGDTSADERALPRYDIITCALFVHHLESDQAVELLRTLSDHTGRLLLVSDLIRSRLGFSLAKAACWLVTCSPVVRYDGPQSVIAAFTVGEAKELCREAGLSDAEIRRRWPERFLIKWRPANDV